MKKKSKTLSFTYTLGDALERIGERISKFGTYIYDVGNKIEHWDKKPSTPVK